MPATLLKKEALAQVFSCEFWGISKKTFFTEHLVSPNISYKNMKLMRSSSQ